MSNAAPASMPLGETFHRQLREMCHARATAFAGDLVDSATLDAVRTSRCNLLARIENTSPGAGAGALACMTVAIPNEAHLLAALHLACGGLHLTMNFDDGIEHAYGLLSGEAELPTGAPASFHDALVAWRRCFPKRAAILQVISRPGELASPFSRRPLLVKLHGSLGRQADGVTLPMAPITDEPDAGDLGTRRGAAFEALAGEGFVVITGFSGSDLASRSALLARLTPGRFWWVAPVVAPDVRRWVEAIDPSQPMAGRSVDAIRAMLPISPPAWPSNPAPGRRFEDQLASWSAGLSPEIAAEALAWALMDAGHLDEAVAILERLVRAGAGTRTQVRLADALSYRRWPGDARVARRLLLRAATKRTDRDLRSYALARWAECLGSGDDAASRLERIVQASAGLVAAAAAGTGRQPTGYTRATSVAVGTALSWIERDLRDAQRSPVRRVLILTVAEVAARTVRRVLVDSAHAPSGRRRATLRRQAIELATIIAFLRAEPPPVSALPSLQELSRVFEHLSDVDGRAGTAGTQALVAIASGDVAGALEAYREATRRRPEPVGVVGLARDLIDAAVRDPRTPPGRDGLMAGSRPPRDLGGSASIGGRRGVTYPGGHRDGLGDLETFVHSLPKVELHIHLEGSVAPSTLAGLARRNGDHRVPWTAAGVERWYEFGGYRDFLNAHVLVCDQLRRPDDFVTTIIELGQMLAAGNVRYAEIAVSPGVHVRRGIAADELFAALDDGRQLVEAREGVRLRWCATTGTRLGPRVAMDTIEMVLGQRPAGLVSFGLAGLESAALRARFAPAFELAAQACLHRVAHAGEAAGPQSIWQAIDVLGAERIGHGIRCLDDPELVERLRETALPLEVCPTSNVRTGVVTSLRKHPLPRLLAAGLAVNLNTDDPAMFHVGIDDQYVAVARAFDLTPAQIADLVRSGVRAAFMSSAEADPLLAEIDAVPLPIEAADSSSDAGPSWRALDCRGAVPDR